MTETQTSPSELDPALAAKLDAPAPEAWKAEKAGDTISGAFLSLEQGSTSFGPAPFVILGTPAGEVSVWLFYESLKTGFLRAKPQPGEIVAIRYEGEKPAKNPTPGRKATYHDYKVIVDRPVDASAPVVWDAALLDRPAGDPPEAA